MTLENLKGKTPVNITIDKTLLEKLEELKRKEKIKSLSPMINQMLWEWLNDWRVKNESK